MTHYPQVEDAKREALRDNVDTGALGRMERYVEQHWPKFGGNVRDIEDLTQLYVVTNGLTGETGELIEHFKKLVRDGSKVAGPLGHPSRELDRAAVMLEFGDVLHYLVRLARMFGFNMTDIIDANHSKLDQRRAAKAAAFHVGLTSRT